MAISSRALRAVVVCSLVGSSPAQAPDAFGAFAWRGIGPANMMGRVAAIDALATDWRRVLVGSASGGVFASDNGGITWTPIFDRYGSGSIGDVVFGDADGRVIWVGTGEASNRNSSGWGDGIYKSTDAGETFVNLGLRDTHHIARIAVDPRDSDTVFVASPGHLWGRSGSRGLFRTRDGGETWQRMTHGLPDDGATGCTEVVVHPRDSAIVLCGMYERLRQPWSMQSGGPNGGLFKSTDGGDTWRKLTDGLPHGPTGMIAIAYCRSHPNVVVANVEADERLPADLSVPGPGVYRSDDGGESWRYLRRHNTRPFYHGQIAIDPLDPDRIYVVSRAFEVSKDGGETWQDKWWGGGGDDHDLWIAPTDPRIRYMATDQGAYLTFDDGRSVLAFHNMAIGQYYAIGVDMRDPYWIGGGLQDNGLWLGPSNSREKRGILNCHNTWIAEGDGFFVQIDPTDWRTVYTVNHVGFAARQDVETRRHTYITPTPETVVDFARWFDPAFPETPVEWTIAPGEHWFFGERPERPRLPPQFRFNWSSPLVLSKANPRTVYFAGNHVFRSDDRGDRWRIVSPDLTTNDPQRRNPSQTGGLTREATGGENFCTIVTVAESPLDPGVLWAGTDDGNVQVTRDAGASWTNVVANVPLVPPGTWVSRVEPSAHAVGTCFVAFDDHRRDDMRPYLFVTDDFGASWRSLGDGLPDGHPVYVVRADAHNARLLFVGTEFGAFASLDRGASWQRLDRGLPTVAVHDLVIHPRDGDLIAGTHGRSVFVLDDISPLQQLDERVMAEGLWLCRPRVATRWVAIDLGRKQVDFEFRGPNPPRGALLHVWSATARQVELTIEDAAGERRRRLRVAARAGLDRVVWDMRFLPDARDVARMRDRLVAALDRLDRVVTGAAEREDLAGLRADLGGARGARGLNAVRARLVQGFAMHAAGLPLFGDKLGPIEAPAGDYRVTARAGDDRAVTILRVREDPLIREGR